MKNSTTLEMAKTTFVVGVASAAGVALGTLIVEETVRLTKDMMAAHRAHKILKRMKQEDEASEEKEETASPSDEFKFEEE